MRKEKKQVLQDMIDELYNKNIDLEIKVAWHGKGPTKEEKESKVQHDAGQAEIESNNKKIKFLEKLLADAKAK